MFCRHSFVELRAFVLACGCSLRNARMSFSSTLSYTIALCTAWHLSTRFMLRKMNARTVGEFPGRGREASDVLIDAAGQRFLGLGRRKQPQQRNRKHFIRSRSLVITTTRAEWRRQFAYDKENRRFCCWEIKPATSWIKHIIRILFLDFKLTASSLGERTR
jgi:hypothetical protein